MFDNEQREELKAMEERIISAVPDVETNMLRQFYDWSKPVEMRLRSIEDIATRMGLVEERVAALERKKFENGK
jgi:hypothetical protein